MICQLVHTSVTILDRDGVSHFHQSWAGTGRHTSVTTLGRDGNFLVSYQPLPENKDFLSLDFDLRCKKILNCSRRNQNYE